jgi:dihydroorotate dehydrogenase (fumarate)
LNRSCPYSSVLLSGRDAWTALAADTVKIVKSAVSIPVSVKFTPQLADPALSAKQLAAAGADGLVMFSRFTGLEIDVETERPVMHEGYAGHGGTWALHYALRWIAAASPGLAAPISASGGVCSGDDVIKFLLAGAASVQVCTAVYMEGFKVMKRYLSRLNQYMEHKGYTAIEEFRGRVCSRVIPADRVDRRRLAAALINEERCSQCGICARVCLYRAVDRGEGTYRINSACAGCGLCRELCPDQAITMTCSAGT